MSESKIEKTVYLVRHGQSVGNVEPVFQAPNSPLSDRGRNQAESIARRVSRLSAEALIASPFQRAKETAEIIAKVFKKQIEFSDLFIERVKPTSINGKPYTDEKVNTIWREWEKSLYTPGMRVEDGENFDDLIVRADRALEFLEGRKEQTLVVVTHGYILRTIVARVLLDGALSAEAFKNFQHSTVMENTGITALRYHSVLEDVPHWRLWIYNDHAHLG